MDGKGFKQMIAEAQAQVAHLDAEQAREMMQHDDVVVLDVREAHERQQGYIPGSLHVPRGYLEFICDPEGPMHNPAVASNKRLILYCGSGGRSALACRTLKEMGFDWVYNLAGGMQGWAGSGYDVER